MNRIDSTQERYLTVGDDGHGDEKNGDGDEEWAGSSGEAVGASLDPPEAAEHAMGNCSQ
jgi:hypothetical protein